ncbi:MAG: NYN domain-containing protein [bacterium]|nr:NYN domain-containing protein [bacterium]
MKKQKPKILSTFAFIDASNIIYSAARSGWKVDFKKLGKYLRERFQVQRILYYAGVDTQNLKQLKFYETLQKFGYELRLVPVRTFSDGSKKADVDSRMTFEMMLHFREYKKAIIMTGDGDYYWVLEYLLKQKQGQIILISHSRTTARDLKKLFANKATDIETLKKIISFKQKK